MKRSEGRIFTTHTGSLPRPAGLVELLGAVARGEPVDQIALRGLAAKSTLDVIKRQAEAGTDIVNSGEQSRTSFSTCVTERMSGFGGPWTRRGHKDQNEFPNIARPRVVHLSPGGEDEEGIRVNRRPRRVLQLDCPDLAMERDVACQDQPFEVIQEVVADRLRLAVGAVGGDPSRIMAGTDCGFDTSASSNRVDKDIVWLKLAAMRQGADLASQSYSR